MRTPHKAEGIKQIQAVSFRKIIVHFDASIAHNVSLSLNDGYGENYQCQRKNISGQKLLT